MTRVKRNWDLLSDEGRKKSIDGIINFFHHSNKEEIGIIFAEGLLDHILQTIGLELYNKGIEDSIDYLRGRIDDIKIDMETLLKK